MPRVSQRAVPRPEEPLILAVPLRAAAVAAVIAALTAVLFVLAANRLAMSHIQHVDSAWLRLMVSVRNTPVTVVAKVFNILGLVYVTLPVRLAIAGYLAFRRQWWHLAAFAAAAFAVLMALTRAYLGAHWLSDAIAGLLVGTSCALLAAVAVDRAQRGWRRRHGIHDVPPQEAVRPADRQ
jgi:hypothetical protein